MTNHIEKLYELAKATKYRAVSIYNPIVGYGDYETIEEASSYGDGFKVEKINSKFTDTKQLELIKKLARIQPIKITDTSENWYVEPSGYYQMTPSKDFSQALAGLVCGLWNDLTDEQREEVRGILQ